MKIKLCAFSCLLCIHCYASTPDSWKTHKQKVISKCIQVSQFKNAKPAGEIISYDDTVGFDALLIRGTYPQPHMKKKAGLELCLFDRKTLSAYTVEANSFYKK